MRNERELRSRADIRLAWLRSARRPPRPNLRLRQSHIRVCVSTQPYLAMRDEGFVTLQPSNSWTLVYNSKTTKKEVDDWLATNQPSVAGAGHAGWVWIRDGDAEDYSKPGDIETMMRESQQLESELYERCVEIDDDPSIPVRGNGNKASLRRIVHQDIAQRLEALAKKTGVTSGE